MSDDSEQSMEEEPLVIDDEEPIGAEETVSTSTSATPAVKRTRELTSGSSLIWQFFERGIEQAKCRFCEQTVKKNDTSNCKKHLKAAHPKEFRTLLDLLAAKEKPFAKKIQLTKKQLTLSQSLARSGTYSADDQRQKDITTAWARAFAGNSLAHSLMENNLFRNALQMMDRRYVPPARDGMKRMIIGQAELLEEKMKSALSSAPKLSLCVDLWSKRALTQSFVGITAHYIDQSRRQFVRLLLSVKEISGKHTAVNIAQNVAETISAAEWNIPDDKIRCIVTDNGANVVIAFRQWQETVAQAEQMQQTVEAADPNLEAESDDEVDNFDDEEEAHFAAFGREKRLPCVAHSLVCALKASIEKAPIYKSTLSQATKVVTSFTTSTSKSDELFKLAGKRLVRPVRTRWIFAYYMLRRLLDLRSEVDEIIESEEMDVGLSPNQWRQVELLCSFLKAFAEHVKELEGEKYVTLNRVIPALMDLIEHCKEFEKVQGLKDIAQTVTFELRRRFGFVLNPMDPAFQPIFAVTTLLDPSVRALLSLKDYSTLLTSAKTEALRLMRQSNSPVEVDCQSPLSSDRSSTPLTGSRYQRLFSKLAEQRDERQRPNTEMATAAETELNNYLLIPLSDINDPIEFWFSQERALPQMFTLALDLFSATATSAPIERVFSHAGIATYGRRNRLEPEALNAELLMKLNHFLFE